MRNTILRIVYAIGVFIITVVLMEFSMNRRSSDTTTEMSSAVLPIVTMENGSTVFNELHGFTDPRDVGAYRGPVTPVSQDREVSFQVDTYDRKVISLSFEVRDQAGTRLIEGGRIEDYSQEGDQIHAGISFQNLISPGNEYVLCILVSTQDAQDVRFYTRLQYFASQEEEETYFGALDFASAFHDNAISKLNKDDVEKYLETSEDASDTDLSNVTIRDSYDQVSYKMLAPTERLAPIFQVRDLQGGQYGIEGTYLLSVKDPETEDELIYECSERYRIYYGRERYQLMDYEREMNQIFDPSRNEVYSAEGADLGITGSLEIMQSGDGSTTAFSDCGRLYAIHESRNEAAYIYGFAGTDSIDRREIYPDHNIRILKVDDSGNVEFLVYGYMNRGMHEGRMGAAYYSYNYEYRTIEEVAFVAYDGSYDSLQQMVEGGSYLTEEGKLYLSVGRSLYEIDTISGNARIVESDMTNGLGQRSSDGRMAAWEEQSGGQLTGNIIFTDLNDLGTRTITASAGERLIPLGFLGDDLIYGIAREADQVKDSAGIVSSPMYCLQIVDFDLRVRENYRVPDLLISGVDIADNQLTVHRIRRVTSETNGEITDQPAADDQIVSTRGQETTRQQVRTTGTELYENIHILQASGLDAGKMRLILPKQALYEGSREVLDTRTDPEDEELQKQKDQIYLVYDLYGCIQRTGNLKSAVTSAESVDGIVMDGHGEYVWRSDYPTSASVDGYTSMEAVPGDSSVTALMNQILAAAGNPTDAGNALAAGSSASEILEGAIQGAVSPDLVGLTIDQIKYYIAQGSPVLAMTGRSQALLIVAYTDKSITVLDPLIGSTYKISLTEASDRFYTAGSRFVSYLLR